MKVVVKMITAMFVLMCLSGCSAKPDESYLRIHIRANSNSAEDQAIKYEIRDIVVSYLTPMVSECKSLDDVKSVVDNNSIIIKTMIDEYLCQNGFEYESSVQINNEFFPTKSYGELTLEASYYDALIIGLGTAQGNNWWCVVYPPLCFTGNNIVYKSKIVELIKKYL